MNPENTGALPKFACKECGSLEVRNDFDTYQVFLAEDDKLIHLRSEFTDPAILRLYCNFCGEQIDADLDNALIV